MILNPFNPEFSVPTEISVGPLSQTINVNTTSIFIGCNASADISTPVTVKWLLNDEPIKYIKGVIERSNFSLMINCRGMTESQRIQLEGKYTAVADNGYSFAKASSLVIAERMPTSAPGTF